ncbi:hypothetical protein OEZ86_007282 [Tetradesmus obliquus]|nr:hypothetical protein OEZ86_007282 [Tetradesmus obliquus]
MKTAVTTTAAAQPQSSWISSCCQRVFKGRLGQQFAALFYKNALVAWRSRRSTAIRLSAPFVFLALALIVTLALNADVGLRERFVAQLPGQKAPDVIESIPNCGRDVYIAGKQCLDFLYTPAGDPVVEALVASIRANNAPPIPASRALGLQNRSQVDEYMMAHPDGALGAVHFTVFSNQSVGYVLQSNGTVKYFKGSFQDPTGFFAVPMINAVGRAIAQLFANTTSSSSVSNSKYNMSLTQSDMLQDAQWRPRLGAFPHPSLESGGMQLQGQVLAVFIFAALMFGCVSQISGLVSEAETGLRLALRTVGMRDSAYWTSWMAFDGLMAFFGALLLTISGMILQFSLLKHNSFGILLLLFWLCGLAMAALSYTLSTLVRKTQSAVYLGFGMFIVGWMFQAAILVMGDNDNPYAPNSYYSKSSRWGRVLFWVFNLMPWNPLTKGIKDLNAATLTAADPGLHWGQLNSYCRYQPVAELQEPYDPRREYRSYDCMFPMTQVYLTLLCQWLVYWALAVYLSNVLPNQLGTHRPLCWFGIPEGQLLCLLGPNGAGKTTTINCLTGVLPFTGGDALIYGNSIATEGGLDAVRPLMGVCPQFDVLWQQLSGREHLVIYGLVKGSSFDQVLQQADELLTRVQLTEAAGVRSGSYSGGMRRRLSVAIALLGDPKIVYLDEPTRGMDPISRRAVWDIIQEAKQNRAIVLTTHSMAEADVLGDRIAIMVRGRLRAIGSSICLKHKFGSGYQLSVHYEPAASAAQAVEVGTLRHTPGAAEQNNIIIISSSSSSSSSSRLEHIKAFFRQGLGLEPTSEAAPAAPTAAAAAAAAAQSASEASGKLLYLVPRQQQQRLGRFLQQLEQQQQRLGVHDVQCSLASLEEVFLTIVKQAEVEAAALNGNALTTVDLPDGSGHLQVPLGQEGPFPHPTPGDDRQFVVKWAQDDEGWLLVLGCTEMQ